MYPSNLRLLWGQWSVPRGVWYLPLCHWPLHTGKWTQPKSPLPSPNLANHGHRKKKKCFQVIILKYLPLSMHACTGSTSFIRQPNPKSLAGLGTFIILAHADLQLQNVYLAVKSLWSNDLWWIQHIVFSSFFGMLFASNSHGEHISLFWYHKYQRKGCGGGTGRSCTAQSLPKSNAVIIPTC